MCFPLPTLPTVFWKSICCHKFIWEIQCLQRYWYHSGDESMVNIIWQLSPIVIPTVILLTWIFSPGPYRRVSLHWVLMVWPLSRGVHIMRSTLSIQPCSFLLKPTVVIVCSSLSVLIFFQMLSAPFFLASPVSPYIFSVVYYYTHLHASLLPWCYPVPPPKDHTGPIFFGFTHIFLFDAFLHMTPCEEPHILPLGRVFQILFLSLPVVIPELE